MKQTEITPTGKSNKWRTHFLGMTPTESYAESVANMVMKQGKLSPRLRSMVLVHPSLMEKVMSAIWTSLNSPAKMDTDGILERVNGEE